MNVPILLITHPGLGSSLRDLCEKIVVPLPTAVEVLEIPFECDVDAMHQQAQALCQTLDGSRGVLILTDLCGATPEKIARKLYQPGRCPVVSGVNLPMLLRALNYCADEVEDLAHKAAEGGRHGIHDIQGDAT